MNGDHSYTEVTSYCDRPRDGVWYLEQLEIEEHLLAGCDQPTNDRRAFRCEQLQADLVELSRRAELLDQLCGLQAVLEFKRNNDAGIWIHGCSTCRSTLL